MKNIAILGSTGSIGVQTLDVIRSQRGRYNVISLVANTNKALLDKQAKEFKVKYSGLYSIDTDALLKAVSIKGIQLVVVATLGISSLDAVIYCIKHNIDIALANKEMLVSCGEVINRELKKSKSKLIPVDSEHSAVFQLLDNHCEDLDSIILTCSGGAFRKYSLDKIKGLKAKDALKHPTWNMGNKITIDSATLMNKGFEVIEATYLFNCPIDMVNVVIEEHSNVHSLISLSDGSILAQLGKPDMRMPISYALSYPDRVMSNYGKVDITKINSLKFEKPDLKRFPCLKLAIDAFKMKGNATCILNAANDNLVRLYLHNVISFYDIYSINKKLINKFYTKKNLTVDLIKSTYKDINDYFIKHYD